MIRPQTGYEDDLIAAQHLSKVSNQRFPIIDTGDLLVKTGLEHTGLELLPR